MSRGAPSGEDRRQVIVRLTASGSSVLRKLSVAHHQELETAGPAVSQGAAIDSPGSIGPASEERGVKHPRAAWTGGFHHGLAGDPDFAAGDRHRLSEHAVAWALLRLIGLFTNLFFFQRWSTTLVSPAGNHLGCVGDSGAGGRRARSSGSWRATARSGFAATEFRRRSKRS